ncbi:monooxygenase 2-like isoform X2 [Aristolochia californica]
MAIKSVDGRELRSFTFSEESPSQEVRAVERGLLLETLANELPADSIRFSSRLKTISRCETGDVLLELEDGTRLISQIVIGCDGIRSPIARWMGFSAPRYVGQSAFRGLAVYPNGQPFEPKVIYTYGRGLRAGLVPISPTKVYWFICYNSSSPGPKITNPSILKRQALELVGGWNSELLVAINATPDETVSKTPLADRWLWPMVSPSVSAGGVVLAGDAWHPMTPNLGQGACCALEDAIALAKKVAAAQKSDKTQLEEALQEYGRERWSRVFPLTIRANLVGSLLHWENPLGCAIRDNIVVPKLVKLGPMLEHTNYECELLK